jgi:hypothetical protein
VEARIAAARVWIMLEGGVSLAWQRAAEPAKLNVRAGDVVLLPASPQALSLTFEGPGRYLEVRQPAPQASAR